METRIENKNLEKMQKTESKNEVSETRIEMDYQETWKIQRIEGQE